MQQQQTSKLYHVKSHGVTQELTHNWPQAFGVYQEFVHKYGSNNVEMLTIADRRTQAQRFPAKGGH